MSSVVSLADCSDLLASSSPPRGPRRVQALASAIRLRIAEGRWEAGDRLPSVRDLSAALAVHPRVVSAAYGLLRGEDVLAGTAGGGTRVASSRSSAPSARAARLARLADGLVTATLAQGFSAEEVEAAVASAAARLRAAHGERQPLPTGGRSLHLTGSHDLSIEILAAHLAAGRHPLRLTFDFRGSLAGLLRLAADRADLAAVHLLDAATGEYNAPYVARLLPGRGARLLLVAEREQGLIVPPGNPGRLASAADLARPGLRLANRQEGSGTRTLLDALLARAGALPAGIEGYDREFPTHVAVALAVAQGSADVGVGIQAAAHAFGLGFVPLAREPYELAYLPDRLGLRAAERLVDALRSEPFRRAVAGLGGYDTARGGEVRDT